MPQTRQLKEESYFTKHQEHAFILKAILASLIIYSASLLLHMLSSYLPYFSEFIKILIPVILIPVILISLYIKSLLDDKGIVGTVEEFLKKYLSFFPITYERTSVISIVPWFTYYIIAINIMVFYIFELNVSYEFIADNLIFIPYKPDFLNIFVSIFTSIFLHASSSHLWGNMGFLWATGTVLERRMGWRQFLLAYFVSGILGSLLATLIYAVIEGITLHGLGASGAIAGLMGVFAIRCYFKNMSFPIPLIGPLNINIRMNSVVLIGLFFAMDLSEGWKQLGGESNSNVGHWVHIGGMTVGVCYAYIRKMQHHAIVERHIEKARDILQTGVGLMDVEREVKLVLQKEPNNVEALEILADVKTTFGRTPEGETTYVKLIRLLSKSNPEEATRIFKKYNENYGGLKDIQLLMKIADIFRKTTNELDMAKRCLRMIGLDGWIENEDKETAKIRETALFELVVVTQQMGDREQAKRYLEIFVDRYPGSTLLPKTKQRLKNPKCKG
ncbi:MAG: rhomboid family intramembrane serine protease [Nitrospirae bacterium]|nr:rhomboid family intramembrane serine protease [Nitrospirota bacterium]